MKQMESHNRNDSIFYKEFKEIFSNEDDLAICNFSKLGRLDSQQEVNIEKKQPNEVAKLINRLNSLQFFYSLLNLYENLLNKFRLANEEYVTFVDSRQ